MKRFFFMSLFAVFFSIFLSVKTFAFELGVGAYTYYNWKEYSWSDAENLQMEPELQIGPVINMSWDRTVSLTLSVIAPFIYKSHADFDFVAPVSGYKVHVDDASMDKSDIDIALSYALTPRFKIFGGAKYINLEIFEGEDTVFTGNNGATVVSNKTEYGSDDGGTDSFYSNKLLGGALGVNYSIPVYNTLAFVTNASLLYFSGEITSTPVIFNMGKNTFETIGDLKTSGSYNSIGGNLAASLSYYAASLNTALSIGGRYQFVYNSHQSGTYVGSDKKTDHIWGVNFSAMHFTDFFEEE